MATLPGEVVGLHSATGDVAARVGAGAGSAAAAAADADTGATNPPAGLLFVRRGMLLLGDGRTTRVLPPGSAVDHAVLHPVVARLSVSGTEHGFPAKPLEDDYMDVTRVTMRAATTGLLVLGFVPCSHVEAAVARHRGIADAVLRAKVAAAELAQKRARAQLADDATDALRQACATGDAAAVEALVAGGLANVHASAAGRTLLHVAAQRGHGAVVELLLAAGVNPNATDSDNVSALHDACQSGSAAAVAALADAVSLSLLNASTVSGDTPAHLVAGACDGAGAARALSDACRRRGVALALSLVNADGKTALALASLRVKRGLRPRSDLGRSAEVR